MRWGVGAACPVIGDGVNCILHRCRTAGSLVYRLPLCFRIVAEILVPGFHCGVVDLEKTTLRQAQGERRFLENLLKNALLCFDRARLGLVEGLSMNGRNLHDMISR